MFFESCEVLLHCFVDRLINRLSAGGKVGFALCNCRSCVGQDRGKGCCGNDGCYEELHF